MTKKAPLHSTQASKSMPKIEPKPKQGTHITFSCDRQADPSYIILKQHNQTCCHCFHFKKKK